MLRIKDEGKILKLWYYSEYRLFQITLIFGLSIFFLLRPYKNADWPWLPAMMAIALLLYMSYSFMMNNLRPVVIDRSAKSISMGCRKASFSEIKSVSCVKGASSKGRTFFTMAGRYNPYLHDWFSIFSHGQEKEIFLSTPFSERETAEIISKELNLPSPYDEKRQIAEYKANQQFEKQFNDSLRSKTKHAFKLVMIPAAIILLILIIILNWRAIMLFFR